MSNLLRSGASRRALSQITQRPNQSRSVANATGPWPGPNPLKDVVIGLSLGLVFAIGFKSWQIHDKAERVRYYQDYERAVKAEEAANSE